VEIAEIHCGARIVTISTQGAGTYIGVVPSRVRSYVSRRFVDAGGVVCLIWVCRGRRRLSGQSVDSSAGSATIEPSAAGDSRSATVIRAGHHPAHLDNRIRVPAPTGGRKAN
jgi:hypothetical protein